MGKRRADLPQTFSRSSMGEKRISRSNLSFDTVGVDKTGGRKKRKKKNRNVGEKRPLQKESRKPF